MKANKALAIALKYQEPRTLKDIIKRIKDGAKLGFTNTSFGFTSQKEADKVARQLTKLGYVVWPSWKKAIDVEWH